MSNIFNFSYGHYPDNYGNEKNVKKEGFSYILKSHNYLGSVHN